MTDLIIYTFGTILIVLAIMIIIFIRDHYKESKNYKLVDTTKQIIAAFIIVFIIIGSYYLGKQHSYIALDDAKENLLEYCTLQVSKNNDSIYVIVHSDMEYFYKNIAVMEEHYDEVIVLHVSQLIN